MTIHRSPRRGAALLLLASFATLISPGVAAAHADLVIPTPADKATVRAPLTEVAGIFSEAMTPSGSSLLVKESSGSTVASGTVDPTDTTRMIATPATPLGAGSYSVEWTSNSMDLHVERGTWTFTVTAAPPSAAATPSAAPSTAPSASAPVATPSASAGPTPLPSAVGRTTGSGDVILPIIVALILIAAGAAYLLSRRNRPSNPT
ncbi:MAG: copper resistance protein CopC [Chloroflexota bacterium]